MTIYNPPVRDMQFALHDVLKLSQSGLPGYEDLDPDFTEAILDAAEQVLRRHGPAKTTVVDVARALGVRPPARSSPRTASR